MASTPAADAVAPTAARTSLPTVFAFGSMGVPLAALAVVAGVYLPRYYVSLGISFLAVAAAISLVRAIDIVFDPLVSLAMDRTKTPIGRYRPWLIVGVPIVMVATWMLLAPKPGAFSTNYLILWSLVSAAGSSMVLLGLAAWTAKLATSYNDRSRVYGWTTGLAVLGSVGILLLPLVTHGQIVLGKASSMPTIGLILIVAIPIALVICALFTPDKITPAAARPKFSFADMGKAISRPAMRRIILADLLLTLGPGTTAPLYVYFFHDAKGFTVAQVGFLLVFYIGAGLFGAPFWGRIAQRLGKHRTVQVACVAYAVCQTTLMIIPKGLFLPTSIGMFAVGFTASAFLVMIRAMVADVTDEVRLEQGQDLTSLIFSMVTTTTKIGGTITVLIVFPILAAVGYNGKEGVVNTPHAIFGLEMCYLFAPIILVWFGGAMFFGYKLDANRHAEIRAALATHDEAAALESMTGPTAATEAAPAE
ncbi:MAG TPA: MFS transporter [Caulobacteraceae bacterium]|jgi:glycoside/pentoside/hexuronide:cation symporter, GPH family